MKRGDWVRLQGRKIAHLVVAETRDRAAVYWACDVNPWPKSICIDAPDAPRCKKCLKAMEIAQKTKERSSLDG